jgi:hypothetical protein
VTGTVHSLHYSGGRRSAFLRLCFANIAFGQELLTFAQLLAKLQAMREIVRTVAAFRSALSTRRDLVFENLPLRHQIGVLNHSDRRFRPCERLLCNGFGLGG